MLHPNPDLLAHIVHEDLEARRQAAVRRLHRVAPKSAARRSLRRTFGRWLVTVGRRIEGAPAAAF